MLDVVHVSEVQGGNPLPQHRVGPDCGGGAVGEVAKIFGCWGSDAWPRGGCELAQHKVADAFLGA